VQGAKFRIWATQRLKEYIVKGFAQQLQIDYPKIPITNDFKLFKNVSEIGKSLVELHLLTAKDLSKHSIKLNGKGNSKVTASYP
jgi:predicted helicase